MQREINHAGSTLGQEDYELSARVGACTMLPVFPSCRHWSPAPVRAFLLMALQLISIHISYVPWCGLSHHLLRVCTAASPPSQTYQIQDQSQGVVLNQLPPAPSCPSATQHSSSLPPRFKLPGLCGSSLVPSHSRLVVRVPSISI